MMLVDFEGSSEQPCGPYSQRPRPGSETGPDLVALWQRQRLRVATSCDSLVERGFACGR